MGGGRQPLWFSYGGGLKVGGCKGMDPETNLSAFGGLSFVPQDGALYHLPSRVSGRDGWDKKTFNHTSNCYS